MAAHAGRVPLWRDVRVLQWVFQLLVVAVVAAIVVWLYGDYTSNASHQNIPTNFDFLDNPTAFEITGNGCRRTHRSAMRWSKDS